VRILAASEKISPNASLLVRFKIMLSSDYVKTFDDAAGLFEIVDWQFANKDGSGVHGTVKPSSSK